jgi:hypothetical protein
VHVAVQLRHAAADRSKFVNPVGGKNLEIHQTKERPEFLAKLLEAYRTTLVADLTEDSKDDELRNFLMRRNNVLLQVWPTRAAGSPSHLITRSGAGGFQDCRGRGRAS